MKKSINKGIIYIIISAFCFATMNIFVKLSGDVNSIQKSFFRNLVAALFALILLLRSKEDFKYPIKQIPLLLLRSLFGTLGVLCNFYAVDHLLVADASMLNKLSPFFAIIASSIILKEKANKVQKISIIIALVGAVFIIKPSIDIISNVNSLIGLGGALGAGIAYTCVRKLGLNGVPGVKIVFFFSCFSCIAVLPYIILNYDPMTTQQLMYLICAGLMAAGGQFAVTAAYTNSPAKEISIFDYSQILFAAILGYFVLNQVPDIYSFIGYVIIISIAVFSFMYQKNRTLKQTNQV